MCLGISQRAMALRARLFSAEWGDLRSCMCVLPNAIFDNNWVVNWEDEEVVVAHRTCVLPLRHPRVRSKLPNRRVALLVAYSMSHDGMGGSALTPASCNGYKSDAEEKSRSWWRVPRLANQMRERRTGRIRAVAPLRVACPKMAALPTAALRTAARYKHHR